MPRETIRPAGLHLMSPNAVREAASLPPLPAPKHRGVQNTRHLALRLPGFWYLATPYSKVEGGPEVAFRMACFQASLLVKARVPVFSPIAHTHPIAIRGQIDPLDHTLWMEADRPFMDAACGLILCTLPGWEESKGVRMELAAFKAAGKPVVVMPPGTVPPELARAYASD